MEHMFEEQEQICNCDGCGWDCHAVCSYDCAGNCDDGCRGGCKGHNQGVDCTIM